MNSTRIRNLVAIPALTAAIVLTGAACGDEDPAIAAASPASPANSPDDHSDSHVESIPDAAAPAGELTITAIDYAFKGVPDQIPVGTRLRIRNESRVELHEVLAFRIPDDEERSAVELIALPRAESTPILGPPRAVVVQTPGSSEIIEAVGDGTLGEPGRYLLMCSIPTGADPDEYLAAAAASAGGPPEGVAGGPPHLLHGMFAEVNVVAKGR